MADQERVFGLDDWVTSLDRMSASLLGITGAEFEISYHRGTLDRSRPQVRELADVLRLIDRLRRREAVAGVGAAELLSYK